jgi:transposase
MITPEMRAQMRRLVLVELWKIETVARRFGVHHSTVRRTLVDAPQLEGAKAPSKVDPHKAYIVDQLSQYPELTSTRLFMMLRDRGYSGGVATLRRYVAQVRRPAPRKVYLRVEVEPGEQAQVDWGSFGHLRIGAAGAQRPLSAFVMVMSWSRALYVDFALDQRMESFLALHQRALTFFGGVPKRVLYDNLKSVVLHHVGATVQFNPRFLDFAGHYLFEPTAAPVRYPEAKGKVESLMRYLRSSFFYGRVFNSLDDVRRQVERWRDEVANQRLHGTTRERPSDRLVVERARLRPLPERPYDTALVVPAVVSKEARVRLDGNTYSVPPDLVGKSVLVRADELAVRVIHDSAVRAEHERSFDRRKHVEDPQHVEQLLARRKGALGPRKKDRIAALSDEARVYLQEIARRRIDLEGEVKKLLRLKDAYGEDDLRIGIARALTTRAFGARYVRALMDQARFEKGLGEPPEPVITGNAAADAIDATTHDLEPYDALFERFAGKEPHQGAFVDDDTACATAVTDRDDPLNRE